MKKYDRTKYWNAVGASIASGPPGRREDVAGQDTLFFRYKRAALLHLLDTIPWQGRRVLEVGCGPGGNIAHLVDLGAKQVIGIDVSNVMAQEASGRVREMGPRIGILIADGTHLPFQSQVADIGLTVTVLQHLDTESADQVVSEMCRVCKDEVVLCEDISVVGAGVRATHVMRRQASYAAMAGSAGFQLQTAIPLKIFASEVLTTLVRWAVDGLLQADSESPSGKRWAVERALLPMSRFVDPYTPQLAGLTCMRFVRMRDGN